MNMNVLKTILEWLQKIVPLIVSAFHLGYKFGEGGKLEAEAELDKARLLLRLRQNEIDNEQNFLGKSADDIVNDVTSGKLR